LAGGSGYTNGQYNNVHLTGGTGTGALALIQVTGNAVTEVIILNAGLGYSAGDVLTATLPGGAGFNITIEYATLPVLWLGPVASFSAINPGSGYVSNTYFNVPLTGGVGSGATANITVSAGAVAFVSIQAGGLGYQVGDVLSASNSYLGGTGSGFTATVGTVAPATQPTAVFEQPIIGSNYDTSTKNFTLTVDGANIYPVTVYGSPTDPYPGVGFGYAFTGNAAESFNWQPGSAYTTFGIPSQLATNMQFSPSVATLTPYGVGIVNPPTFTMTWSGASENTGMVSNSLFIDTTGSFTLNTTLPVPPNNQFTVTGLPVGGSYRVRSDFNLGGVKSAPATQAFFPAIGFNVSVTDGGNFGVGSGYPQFYAVFTDFTAESETETDYSQFGVGYGSAQVYSNFTNYTAESETQTDYSEFGVGYGYALYYGYTVAAGAEGIG
jgi:hypothetical protein